MVDGIPIAATCPDERKRDENVARALRHDREHEVLRDAYCKAQDENARLKAIHATWEEWFGHLREVLQGQASGEQDARAENIHLRWEYGRLKVEEAWLRREWDYCTGEMARLEDAAIELKEENARLLDEVERLRTELVVVRADCKRQRGALQAYQVQLKALADERDALLLKLYPVQTPKPWSFAEDWEPI